MTTALPEPMTLRGTLDDAFAGIRERLQAFESPLVPREVGTVASVSTGIARVHGLPHVGFEELLEFSGGLSGIAFNLDVDGVDVVLLGDHTHLHAGQEVQRTGRVMDVAVGDALLGRVIDPLGRPLDGLGRVATSERLPIERPAAAIMDRAPVTEPLQTGLKVIDMNVLTDRQFSSTINSIFIIVSHIN